MKAAPKEQRGRVMGVYYGTFNIGFIAGPLIGAPLANTFGLASPLWAYGFACFVAAIAFWRSIRDLEAPGGSEPSNGARLRLPWSRAFVTVLVISLVEAWILAGASTLIPLFATDRLAAPALGAIGITVWSIPEFAILYPAGVLVDRVGRKPVMVPALLLFIAVLGSFGLVTAGWSFLLLLGALGICTGLGGVPPAVMLADVTPPERSGQATGMFRFASDLGFVIGPLVAGATADWFGLGWGMALMALPCLVSLGFMLSIADTRPVLRRADLAEPA
jgi:MFS family permease